MQYINPIEILGLSNATDITSIDNETIKKAKRKLFADIDLSDNGFFEYHGLQLTKSDCEKAIDELSSNELKEFYLYLCKNDKLNAFLVNGNNEVFENFKKDKIFQKLEFVKFISPYFAPKFDKALLEAFENEIKIETKAILKTSLLITRDDLNIAFRSVTNFLNNGIEEVENITDEIKNEESNYTDDTISDVLDIVKYNFPSKTINLLPNYFQSQISKIASSINYLSNSIWDEFDSIQVSNDLTAYLLTLNIGGLDRPTFEKNFEIINKANTERIEQAKNAPTIEKYAEYLIQAKSKIAEIKNKTITPINLLSWVNSTISITDLNNLSSVFDEIKNQVALSLRVMSVHVWNSYVNIDVSIDLINKANNITGLNLDTQQNIKDAKNHLTELKFKSEIANLLNKSEIANLAKKITTTQSIPTNVKNRVTVKPKESNNWSVYIILAIVFIIGFMIWVKFNKSSTDNYQSTTDSYSESSTSESRSYSNGNTTPEKTNEYVPPVESKYKGNQLKNGDSPLTGCFGKGIYSGNATLTVKNGGNSDAIICLYSISKNKTIRNEYIQKNSSFTMSKIAQGKYKIRVFYGNDWNPTLVNNCGTKGNFESDVNFSEFDGTEYFEDSDKGYTIATITLYTVIGGNASSSEIDQSKFFNK